MHLSPSSTFLAALAMSSFAGAIPTSPSKTTSSPSKSTPTPTSTLCGSGYREVDITSDANVRLHPP